MRRQIDPCRFWWLWVKWPWKAGREESNFPADLLTNPYTVWRRTTTFGRITRVGRSVYFWGQPRPYCKGAGPQRSPIYGFPSIYACTFWCRTTKFDIVTHAKRGLVCRWSATRPLPHPNGRVPALPYFGSSFLFLRIPFVAELPNLTWQHVGEGCILGSATPPIPGERSFSAPEFGGSPVCSHPFT